MKIVVSEDKMALGKRAAHDGATAIRAALGQNGAANIIVATGASQFEMLETLVREPDIDWSAITAFHLDEYVGMPITHAASFRKYLKERFVEQLPAPLKAFHYIDGEGDVKEECRRLGGLIVAHPIDVAFVGIGENAHLAFNDPPADFATAQAYLVVTLDDDCRRQQLGEGWFPTFEDVPTQAISMSIPQILKSKTIVCSVPDARKAVAAQKTVEGPITNTVPSSIMQDHADTTIYLDAASAGLLTTGVAS